MTMRVTMQQTRMGESGSLLNSGQTYTVSRAFGAALVGAGFATDTDSLASQPDTGTAPPTRPIGSSRNMLPSDWGQQLEFVAAAELTITAASIAGVRPGSVVALTSATSGTVTITGSGVQIRGTATLSQYATIGLQLKANGEVWVI